MPLSKSYYKRDWAGFLVFLNCNYITNKKTEFQVGKGYFRYFRNYILITLFILFLCLCESLKIYILYSINCSPYMERIMKNCWRAGFWIYPPEHFLIAPGVKY